MAKNYILEPTELTFRSAEGSFGSALKCDDALVISPIKSKVTVGMVFDFNNGDKFIVYENVEGHIGASRDGLSPSSPSDEAIHYSGSGEVPTLIVKTNNTTEAGTYTVSIYTETEEPNYPVKNAEYEFLSYNDVEGIRWHLEGDEAEDEPKLPSVDPSIVEPMS